MESEKKNYRQILGFCSKAYCDTFGIWGFQKKKKVLEKLGTVTIVASDFEETGCLLLFEFFGFFPFSTSIADLREIESI